MLRSTKECTVAAPDCACRAFRSHAVQVTESAPERWTLGFSGRSQLWRGVWGETGRECGWWVSISEPFFCVFFSAAPNHFFMHFRCHLRCFGVTFRVYFRCPWKLWKLKPLLHENHSFTDLEGSSLVPFGNFFWRLLLGSIFSCFLWIQWHFGGPLGCLFGDNFRVFFWFVHIGCPEGVLGRQKWPFWVPFGGLGPRFGSLFARFWSLLEYHQINTNI